MQRDLWTWRAHYRDGSTLDEFDADGRDHGFADVDQSRLAAFELLPAADGLQRAVLLVTGDLRPIFFRRRTVTVSQSGESEEPVSIHVLGWQRTVAGQNVKSFTAYYPDGSVLVTDDDREISL